MSLAERVFGGGDPPTVRVSTADAVNVLKNDRRRRVIAVLADHGGPMRLGDLAEQLAAREYDMPPEKLSSQQRKRIYVGLYQCHLDVLEDGQAIAPWTNTQPVRPGPDLDGYEALRQLVEERTMADSEDCPESEGGMVSQDSTLPENIAGIFSRNITKVTARLPRDREMATGGDEA